MTQLHDCDYNRRLLGKLALLEQLAAMPEQYLPKFAQEERFDQLLSLEERQQKVALTVLAHLNDLLANYRYASRDRDSVLRLLERTDWHSLPLSSDIWSPLIDRFKSFDDCLRNRKHLREQIQELLVKLPVAYSEAIEDSLAYQEADREDNSSPLDASEIKKAVEVMNQALESVKEQLRGAEEQV